MSKILKAPLDIFVSRKIWLPSYPELGIGAIAPNGTQILDRKLINSLNITENEIKRIIESETIELHRRLKLYRGDLPLPDLTNRTVILVDDVLLLELLPKFRFCQLKICILKK